MKKKKNFKFLLYLNIYFSIILTFNLRLSKRTFFIINFKSLQRFKFQFHIFLIYSLFKPYKYLKTKSKDDARTIYILNACNIRVMQSFSQVSITYSLPFALRNCLRKYNIFLMQINVDVQNSLIKNNNRKKKKKN